MCEAVEKMRRAISPRFATNRRVMGRTDDESGGRDELSGGDWGAREVLMVTSGIRRSPVSRQSGTRG